MNGQIIVSILYILVSILTFVGLIFLTQLSFGTKVQGGNVRPPSNMNSAKLTISRITIALVWFQIIVAVIYAIAMITVSRRAQPPQVPHKMI